MSSLSRYLLRLFSTEAAALFGVAAFLLFLIQCLRLFDVVSDRGQNILTLIGQALLGMPGLGIVFLYVCLGIGLGRALRSLEDRKELQIIHVSTLVPVLLRAILGYAIGGSLILLILSHIVDPVSVRSNNDWATSIAADLVSRSMVPHRFTEVVDDVSIIIGSRDSQGQITDFFAHDRRGDNSRTYFAKSAIITRDEIGFVLRMKDGAMQQLNDAGRFSEVSFAAYDLALDRLTGSAEDADALGQTSSITLIGDALASGVWSPEVVAVLIKRSVEGLRVFAIILFVAALRIFPSGRRRNGGFPIEVVVLGAAFLERAVSSYLPLFGPLSPGSGAICLAIAAVLILMFRLRNRIPAELRAAA